MNHKEPALGNSCILFKQSKQDSIMTGNQFGINSVTLNDYNNIYIYIKEKETLERECGIF